MKRETAVTLTHIFKRYGCNKAFDYDARVRINGYDRDLITPPIQTPSAIARTLRDASKSNGALPANDDLSATVFNLPVELILMTDHYDHDSQIGTTLDALSILFDRKGRSTVRLEQTRYERSRLIQPCDGPPLDRLVSALEHAGTAWREFNLIPFCGDRLKPALKLV